MKIDNDTPYKSTEYNNNIKRTIPYYEQFNKEIIDLVKVYNPKCKVWIDSGSGTGIFAAEACKEFKKTKFILSDISEAMLNIAKENSELKNNSNVEFIGECPSEKLTEKISIKADVVTAIQVHHYLKKDQRKKATQNCYDILNNEGMYITFENIRPAFDITKDIALKRWESFQIKHGRDEEAVKKHLERFDTGYFPITVAEHLQILKEAGFKYYDIFWYSQMQCGFYAIK